jgi:hypothetical protein
LLRLEEQYNKWEDQAVVGVLAFNEASVRFLKFEIKNSNFGILWEQEFLYQPSCRSTAHVPDSYPREFGLNSKKQAFSLAPFFCNLADIATL